MKRKKKVTVLWAHDVIDVDYIVNLGGKECCRVSFCRLTCRGQSNVFWLCA